MLSNRTEGYMAAKPDRTLCLNVGGRHVRWGAVTAGPTAYWWSSPRGQSSSLTLSDGTCFVVDFTGASGADVMLVTTGKAEGPSVTLGDRKLTFCFPTAATAPTPTRSGDAAVIGRQRVTFEDGHLIVAEQGE